MPEKSKGRSSKVRAGRGRSGADRTPVSSVKLRRMSQVLCSPENLFRHTGMLIKQPNVGPAICATFWKSLHLYLTSRIFRVLCLHVAELSQGRQAKRPLKNMTCQPESGNLMHGEESNADTKSSCTSNVGHRDKKLIVAVGFLVLL